MCVCPVLCGRVWPSRCVHAASSVRHSLAYMSVCVRYSAAGGVTDRGRRWMYFHSWLESPNLCLTK